MSQTIILPDYSVGPTALQQINMVCSPYGKKVFIVGGKTALEKAEKKLHQVLKSNCFEIVDTFLYGSECTYNSISAVAKKATENKADFIIGVGGGKALDTAKAGAFEANLPVFCVPTIASTCAATTKLSVVYNEDGTFADFYFFPKPAIHTFIDTQIIANAPFEFLRAGIGDTIAKHYECTFASKHDQLDHSSGVAREISKMCVDPMFIHANKALQDCTNNQTSAQLEQVILGIVVTTGLVSLLIEEKYNGALAHSVFYALTLLPHIEENYLHGDVVAYGVLVQLIVDLQLEEAKKLQQFFVSLNIPTKLKDISVNCNKETLTPIIENIFTQPDMQDIPYPITFEMVFDAMQTVESL